MTQQTDEPAPTLAGAPEPLVRRLGLWALWLLIINGMIGAGIFAVPAGAELLAGAFSPWIFALCALAIAPIMLCFAQLASAFNSTGGPVLYARTAFGPFVGFQIGWAFYIARLTGFAANLNLIVVSIGYFFPEHMGDATRIGMLFALCAALVWINLIGVRAAMQSLGVLTVLKLLPLVALAAIGLIGLDRAVFTAVAQPPGLGDLGAAVLLVIYTYVGFESGLVPGGESRNPQRDMPRALLLALVIVTGVYVLVQVATRRLVPDLAGSDHPVVEAGDALLGPIGAFIVLFAIIASVGGNLVGNMFSSPRITYRLGLDGQLPAAFASVHPKHETPWNSVIIYGVAAFLLAASGSFVWLAVLSVFTRLLIFLTCIAAMPRVRKAAGDAPGLIRLPGGPAIPILAVLVCLALLTRVSLGSVLVTLAMLAVGSVLFALAVAQRRRVSLPEDGPPD
ncbi:MAG: APC family permease [Phycisphaerales bacterium]|nr:amino acid permease [Planctomycetota bacterium]MCH8508960.1 APC family permease [Phycisphaerales bacterium]